MTDFPALLQCLSAAGVEYILVGGAAAVAHGSVRLTQDIDVVDVHRALAVWILGSGPGGEGRGGSRGLTERLAPKGMVVSHEEGR